MPSPGNRPRVQQLVEEHYQALYRYGYRLSGSSAEAEDLVQETYCTAQAKLGQLREAERAKSWLFSILRNAYLHRVRVAKREEQVPPELFGELPERVAEPLPEIDPEQLQKALSELPEVFRTPIILYYFEDFSYRAIAEQMDLPMGTVMSRLARAKAYLRGRLLAPPSPVLADGSRRLSDGV